MTALMFESLEVADELTLTLYEDADVMCCANVAN